MKKKQKRVKNAVIATILILLVGVGVLGWQFFVLASQNKDLTSLLNQNTKNVYVATKKIKAGEKLVEDKNVKMQKIRTGLEPGFYMSAAEVGRYASINIDKGTPILYSMTSEDKFAKDTREYEVSVANLTTDQANYDTVDIRIMFPNGEDYIILPKRKITHLNMKGSTFTCLANEEEILRMSSAIIDAFQKKGAYIYTTRYVETSQEAAEPTYLVKAENIDLINSDPNVLTKAVNTLNLDARLSLETRLGSMTENQTKDVVDGQDALKQRRDATIQDKEKQKQEAQAEGGN